MPEPPPEPLVLPEPLPVEPVPLPVELSRCRSTGPAAGRTSRCRSNRCRCRSNRCLLGVVALNCRRCRSRPWWWIRSNRCCRRCCRHCPYRCRPSTWSRTRCCWSNQSRTRCCQSNRSRTRCLRRTSGAPGAGRTVVDPAPSVEPLVDPVLPVGPVVGPVLPVEPVVDPALPDPPPSPVAPGLPGCFTVRRGQQCVVAGRRRFWLFTPTDGPPIPYAPSDDVVFGLVVPNTRPSPTSSKTVVQTGEDGGGNRAEEQLERVGA